LVKSLKRKKMAKKKYLELYYKWLECGILPRNGLCNCFGAPRPGGRFIPDKSYLEFMLMFPPEDYLKLNLFPGLYWGVESTNVSCYHRVFSPLRQNIVLFMAAMNGEFEEVKEKKK
jgi:hypothetical protein